MDMLKLITTNKSFQLYGPQKLNTIVPEILEKLEQMNNELKELFNIKTIEPLRVEFNIKKDQESEEYNTIENNVIKITICESLLEKKYCADLIAANIKYEQIINIYKKQAIYPNKSWIANTLAQYYSGLKSKLFSNEEQFRNWFINKIIHNFKEIPTLEFINTPGTQYGQFVDNETNKYNGYQITALIAAYLLKNNIDLKELIYNQELINKLEPTIINSSVDFFKEKFNTNNIPINFSDIKTPEELMDYMNLNMKYGYVSKEGELIYNTLQSVREKYVTLTPEEIITKGIGTCADQTKLEKCWFDLNGIENKIYCDRIPEYKELTNEPIQMHCFIIYKMNNKWYLFEHSNERKRGIFEYSSSKEIINERISLHEPDSTREISEIDDIPSGLTYLELNQYVNKFNKIELGEQDEEVRRFY